MRSPAPSSTFRPTVWIPVLALLALLPACGTRTVGQTKPLRGPALSLDVRKLSEDYWETYLSENPEQATVLGDHRFDDRLTDNSVQGRERRATAFHDLKRRADLVRSTTSNRRDWTTLAMLRQQLDNQIFHAETDMVEWSVDPLRGPHVRLLNLLALQTWSNARSADALLSRLQAIPAYMENMNADLERGLSKGRAASRSAVEKTLKQLDALLAHTVEESPIVVNAMAAGSGAGSALQKEIREQVTSLVRTEVAPAFATYRDLLRNRVLPNARSNDQPGVLWMPGGDLLYQRLIVLETSLNLTSQELHQFGMEEVDRIRAEIAALGKKQFGSMSFADTQQRLMNDPALYFSTRDEVEAKAASATRKGVAAIKSYFGIKPKAKVEVQRIPGYEEADTTMAFYRGPSESGRPGVYWINTYEPHTRARYNAEVLAYHESVPGHHLQIAIAAELTGIPEFRKHQGTTAYVEGWALYTERLCAEMGLYTGDLDRIGMLGFDAWRASRLVVDTGLHAYGWSRDRAIRFMADNTLLKREEIVNEVDRYIAWPGQALAYKVGQREILKLREAAKAAMGPRFSLPGFHDVVLRDGAVTLGVLRENVTRWAGGRDQMR